MRKRVNYRPNDLPLYKEIIEPERYASYGMIGVHIGSNERDV
jgi:hypothetical protein